MKFKEGRNVRVNDKEGYEHLFYPGEIVKIEDTNLYDNSYCCKSSNFDECMWVQEHQLDEIIGRYKKPSPEENMRRFYETIEVVKRIENIFDEDEKEISDEI